MRSACGPACACSSAATASRAMAGCCGIISAHRRAFLANRRQTMPVIVHADVPSEPFVGGATYQHVVGDRHGSTPFRIGIQTSPPGYRTPLHSHPYTEALTILEGEGEAWMEGR